MERPRIPESVTTSDVPTAATNDPGTCRATCPSAARRVTWAQKIVDQSDKFVSGHAVPLDQQASALEQVPQMIAEHSPAAWSAALDASAGQSRPSSELSTLLLAVNYELLGYTPREARMFARREEFTRPGQLDG